MNHYIITRFNIDCYRDLEQPETWVQNRIKLFEEYTIPSMLRQTNQQFKWLVLFDQDTPPDIVARYDGRANIIPVVGGYLDAMIDAIDKTSPPVITSRLDSDDYVEANWVNDIQLAAAKVAEDTIIDLHGRIYEVATGRYFDPVRPYPSSMFVSLVEFGDVKTAWVYQHNVMWGYYPYIHLPQYGWVVVVHDHNLLNAIEPEMHTDGIPQERYLTQNKI